MEFQVYLLYLFSVFEEPEDPTNRSFFSEIISSISDVKFSNSGRYMISRDYLSVKVWDLHMETKPIETYTVRVFGILSARNLFLSASWDSDFLQTRNVFNNWFLRFIYQSAARFIGVEIWGFFFSSDFTWTLSYSKTLCLFSCFQAVPNEFWHHRESMFTFHKKKNMTIFPSIFQHEEKYEIITWIFIFSFFISGSWVLEVETVFPVWERLYLW